MEIDATQKNLIAIMETEENVIVTGSARLKLGKLIQDETTAGLTGWYRTMATGRFGSVWKVLWLVQNSLLSTPPHRRLRTGQPGAGD